ncbi:class F sortase [Agreia sp. COWG]|uniref:class F sortase n=1 Tax=Agreia sp. COWG TaxID=2773266 RepID=UPI001928B716|nr:class F sortase [Agreia sp. COWG]
MRRSTYVSPGSVDPGDSRSSTRDRFPIVGAVLLSIVGLCVAAALILGVLLATGSPVVAPLIEAVAPPVDEQAAAVAAAVAEDAAAEQIVEEQNGGVAPQPVAGQPLRIRIPAVGLDAEVRAMGVPESRELDPPGPYRAYWISDFGVAGAASTNTTYIAGHTYRDGSAVFNPLLDVPQSAGAVSAGESIVVTTPGGDASYTITSTELYDKSSIEQQTELWQQVPGRLVVVTCFQYNGGTSSTQNFVVYAQLDPGQG